MSRALGHSPGRPPRVNEDPVPRGTLGYVLRRGLVRHESSPRQEEKARILVRFHQPRDPEAVDVGGRHRWRHELDLSSGADDLLLTLAFRAPDQLEPRVEIEVQVVFRYIELRNPEVDFQ